MSDHTQPFEVLGPARPARPVVISVPHAGRNYPAALLAATRLPRERLELLEDRYADLLIGECVAAGFTAIVARRARAWIDLNRDAREIDAEMVEPRPRREVVLRTARVASGLGLVPRRLRGSGDIWSRKLALTDLQTRIDHDHRPYHDRLASLLERARADHGTAVLLDVHSMPPLDGDDAQIVIGDRFGQSASARFAEAARAAADRCGRSVAFNMPYAGGYILERHGAPRRSVHALQIEIDRSLYLDETGAAPKPGLGQIPALIHECTRVLEDEALGGNLSLAAE